jgi:hypothetical protein
LFTAGRSRSRTSCSVGDDRAVGGPATCLGRGTARFRLGVAYLLLLCASAAASQDPRASLRELSEIFGFAALGLALVHLRGEKRVRWLVDAVILVGTLIALSGLGQFLIGMGGVVQRIRGPFSHYMTFAGYLLLVDLLLVGRLLRRHRGASVEGGEATAPTRWLDRTWLALLCLALVNTALVSSLTRSAWLAFAAALLLVVGLVRPRLLPAHAAGGGRVAQSPGADRPSAALDRQPSRTARTTIESAWWRRGCAWSASGRSWASGPIS